jgi:hypothetical protein
MNRRAAGGGTEATDVRTDVRRYVLGKDSVPTSLAATKRLMATPHPSSAY